ncbi:MAG: OmpA family protein [Planctomycetota bacterium]
MATGCVSKEDYYALELERDTLAQSLGDAERRAAANKSLADGLRDQLGRMANAGDSVDAIKANYEMQIAGLTSDRDDLARRYQELLGKIGTGPALPEALTSELNTFAAQNPDLVTFDSERGIVKFKSDVTFTSGDAALKPEAKSVIERFAQILNGPVARNFELRVEGHTDNVPVSSELTKKKGHLDNWYLSSHRAITVGKALSRVGVNPQRIGVLGFADQRPATTNDTAAGRAQNRRVEVLILPTTLTAVAKPQAEAATPAVDAKPAAAITDAPATTQTPAPAKVTPGFVI